MRGTYADIEFQVKTALQDIPFFWKEQAAFPVIQVPEGRKFFWRYDTHKPPPLSWVTLDNHLIPTSLSRLRNRLLSLAADFIKRLVVGDPSDPNANSDRSP